MKNIILLVGLLLTMNSYCYYDTLKPVLNIYDSKVELDHTTIFSTFNLKTDTGTYIFWIDSLPETVNALSLDFPETPSIIIYEVSSFFKKPKKENFNDVLNRILILDEKIAEIEMIKIDLKEEESILKQNYRKFINGASNRERLEIIKLANEKIQQVRVAINIQESKQKNIENEISYLIQNSKLKSNKIIQQVYLKLRILNPINHFQMTYELSNAEKETELELAPKDSIANVSGFWIHGKVADRKSNFFLSQAKVHVLHQGKLISQTNTNENGFFKIELLHPGPYDLEIERYNYKSKRYKNIWLIENQVNLHDFELKSANRTNAIEIMTLALPMMELVKDVVE